MSNKTRIKKTLLPSIPNGPRIESVVTVLCMKVDVPSDSKLPFKPSTIPYQEGRVAVCALNTRTGLTHAVLNEEGDYQEFDLAEIP